MLTLIIIGVGFIVFLLLLIITICACKAKNKKNEQNKIVIMSNDPTSTPVTSKAKQNRVRELKPVDQTDHESNINTPADFSDKTRATMSNKVSAYPEQATIDNGDKSNDV
jgi:heme/copper-type cytochrome/quinol oxidase subunit 1